MPDMIKGGTESAKSLEDIEKRYGAKPGELQREMAELAELAGDWKEHLPYEVARSFYLDDALQHDFAEHVDACPYCQRLLETLHPTDEAVAAFGAATVTAVSTPPAVAVPRQWRRVAVSALAASLVTAVVGYSLLNITGLGLFGGDDTRTAEVRPTAAQLKHAKGWSTQVDTTSLQKATAALREREQKDNIEAQFAAAQIFFLAGEKHLAYKRLTAGLVSGGVDRDVADMLLKASVVHEPVAVENLAMAFRELEKHQMALAAKSGGPVTYIKVAGAQARLGQHVPALTSIRAYLTSTKQNTELVALYEAMLKGLVEEK